MSCTSLILASASPRRSDLLARLGVEFTVCPANINEFVHSGELPLNYVVRMAREKAAVIAALQDDDAYAVLAADTTVVLDEKILGKPVDQLDGLDILSRLSGRTHAVTTAVCLQFPDSVTTISVTTDVQFLCLSKRTCEVYLETDEPWDKAGSYAIQGLAGAFVKEIHGSYSNVIGLPLAETWELLQAHHIATRLTGSRE